MAEEMNINNGNVKQPENANSTQQGGKVIDEANYQQQYQTPRPEGPTSVGRGGDPFFKRIYAPKEQIDELMEETTTVQDWVQRETSNKVALACLENQNLKEAYYKIKDGFGDYGPIMLMGFKTPQGVEIPRLKLLGTNGEVLQVLTGPMAMEELEKRAKAFEELSTTGYETVELPQEDVLEEIPDYTGIVDASETIQEYTG